LLKKKILNNEHQQNELSINSGLLSRPRKNSENPSLKNLSSSNFLEISSDNTNLNKKETEILKDFGLIKKKSMINIYDNNIKFNLFIYD